ncbi:hypothetical protein H6F94_17990 [Leptolyngbya sp. FACHB-261]|nr:hypothetical protein [Leptolyngbya sp. FACHB-261]
MSEVSTYLKVFIFFWSLFALTNSGFDNSEGGFHYQVAEHIIETGQLGFETSQPGIFTVAPNGRTYASHEIGNTLFFLPIAWLNLTLQKLWFGSLSSEQLEIAKEFVRSFQPSFYSAITLAAFFGILRLGFAQKRIPALLATSGLALTTFFWTHTRESFDGVLCSTLLTISFLFLLRFKQQKSRLDLIIAFASLGFGFITRISMVLAIVVSIGYLVSISRPYAQTLVRNLGLALLTLVPFVVWQSWYNQLRTGIFYLSPVQTDAKYRFANALDGNLLVGLQGILASPGKSIFIYAPLLILSVLLFRKFWKNHPKEALYILVLSLAWLLLHARLRSWYGSWGWGPRHFITILPILFIPFAANIELVLRKAYLKVLALLLGSLGFVLALASMISDWHFRMVLADGKTLSDEFFVWSLRHSQPVDMLTGVLKNLITVFKLVMHSPSVQNQNLWFLNSGLKEYGSFTVNFWPNNLIFAGVAWYWIVPPVVLLIVLMFSSLRSVLASKA